jgi:hypothetical protein
MSWEDVPQPGTKALRAAVSASLKPGVGGHIRMTVTISPDVHHQLGWTEEQHLVLLVGRGRDLGRARIAPQAGGRRLRMIPRSAFRMVSLTVPEDLARWEAPQMPVETWQVVRGVGLPALEIVLPWDLSGDPTAEAEAEAA